MTTPVDYLYQFLAALDTNEVSLKFEPVYQATEEQMQFRGLYTHVDWPSQPRAAITAIFRDAERFGLSLDLDKPIFKLLFRYIEQHPSEFSSPEQLYVSASISSFTSDALVKFIVEKAEDIEFNLARLTICLDETSPSKDYEKQLANLNDLRSYGINLSISHNGTHLPRVDLLTKPQFKYISVSEELALNYNANRYTLKYLKGIISTLKSLDKKIIVSGVRDANATNFFLNCGVEYYSGPVFQDPINVHELSELYHAMAMNQ